MEWKTKVLDKVDEKSKYLSKKRHSKFHESIHQQSNPINTFHNQFFVTSIDKADGNIAFVCQRFYALVLIKELS